MTSCLEEASKKSLGDKLLKPEAKWQYRSDRMTGALLPCRFKSTEGREWDASCQQLPKSQ